MDVFWIVARLTQLIEGEFELHVYQTGFFGSLRTRFGLLARTLELGFAVLWTGFAQSNRRTAVPAPILHSTIFYDREN